MLNEIVEEEDRYRLKNQINQDKMNQIYSKRVAKKNKYGRETHARKPSSFVYEN